MLLSAFFGLVAGQMLYFALHLESSSFPKPLPKKEETLLFKAYQEGDEAARDTLIKHNLRLVAHIVKKYYAGAAEQEDLVSIGTIGLIKAVQSFDPTRAARFSTYAARCIENEILMVFRSSKKTQGTVSISDPIEGGDGENSLTINDVVADTRRFEEDYENEEEAGRLRLSVDRCLSGRQRQIVLMRYGLAGQPPQTQQQVASALSISRSYVSRLEKKALEELKTELEKT